MNKLILAVPTIILLCLALLFTATYSNPEPVAPPQTAPELASDPITEERIYTLVNAERTSKDLPAYEYDPILDREAQEHAEQLCTAGINHELFISKVNDLEYRSSLVGENLAHDFERSDSLVKAWINSPKHHEAIISTTFNETGIGIAECENTTVVVQWFGINQ